jgi:hypothetical protein
LSPCLHVFMSSCLHVSMSPCLHVSMSPCPCLNVSRNRGSKTKSEKIQTSAAFEKSIQWMPYCKWKMELTENSNFSLFAANEKRKWQTVICLQ